MAMELFVLSDQKLKSVSEWQHAINGEGYSLRLEDGKSIESLKGFLPARLHNTKTGFECGCWSIAQFHGAFPDVKVNQTWKYALTLRWGGDLRQLEAAWIAAAAYAQATRGVIFDEQDGKIKSASEARAAVHDIISAMPKAEAILREIKGQTPR